MVLAPLSAIAHGSLNPSPHDPPGQAHKTSRSKFKVYIELEEFFSKNRGYLAVIKCHVLIVFLCCNFWKILVHYLQNCYKKFVFGGWSGYTIFVTHLTHVLRNGYCLKD